jgi:ACR3 family arsenite transporter
MVAHAPQATSKVSVNTLAAHLSRFLLAYTVAAIAFGWGLGLLAPGLAAAHRALLGTLTTVLVFLMIYPMMVNLNLEAFGRVVHAPRPVLMSLVYNYVLTPALTYALVRLLIHSPLLGLGLLLVMLVPGSSMSLGYTGLVGGSLEVGTIAMAVNFLLVPVLLPLYLHALSRGGAPVPLRPLIQALLLVLILPMALGLVTRAGIVRRTGPAGMARIRPYLSVATICALLPLMAAIFFGQGEMLAKRWTLLVPLFAATVGYLVVILALSTWLDRRLGLSYEEHMGIAFLTSGKNNGTAIAITTLAFGPLVAVPAATLPLFQSTLLILYVQLAPWVRRYFRTGR